MMEEFVSQALRRQAKERKEIWSNNKIAREVPNCSENRIDFREELENLMTTIIMPPIFPNIRKKEMSLEIVNLQLSALVAERFTQEIINPDFILEHLTDRADWNKIRKLKMV